MTTAHRPTWKAAYGLSDNANKGYVPTRSYSARDLPSYLNLKERQIGQGSIQQLKQRDFKAQLLKRQSQLKRLKNGEVQIIKPQSIQDDINPYKRSSYDNGVDFIPQDQQLIKKKIKRPNQGQKQSEVVNFIDQNPFPQDGDSQSFVNEQSSLRQQKKKRISSDQDQSDQQDSQQLLRQYERIKQQREKQKMQKHQQKHKFSMANKQTEILKGNPLIDSSYSISKRWYEDTVFRNQAKKVQEKKSFINDYVRSEFHRKFMNRYICR